jgi:DNA polymerase-3 subunit epsilon
MSVADLKDERSIVVLDVETTGKERTTDQIIEICLRFGLGPEAETRTWRIRPEVPIHPEALAVHGITMEALADCPLFTVAATEFLPMIMEAELIVGYNVAFDLDMLQAELARAGIPPLSFAGKQIIDVLRLWHYAEPRTLVAAHAKFCGEALVDAHQAAADVAATARVLASMLVAFGFADKSWSEIAQISDPFSKRATWLGPSSHIQWDASGAVVFGFGKHKGQQVALADGGFLRWVLAKDFPPHVQKICRIALERRGKFDEWVTTYYPRPSIIRADAARDIDDGSSETDPLAPDAVQGVLL